MASLICNYTKSYHNNCQHTQLCPFILFILLIVNEAPLSGDVVPVRLREQVGFIVATYHWHTSSIVWYDVCRSIRWPDHLEIYLIRYLICWSNNLLDHSVSVRISKWSDWLNLTFFKRVFSLHTQHRIILFMHLLVVVSISKLDFYAWNFLLCVWSKQIHTWAAMSIISSSCPKNMNPSVHNLASPMPG